MRIRDWSSDVCSSDRAPLLQAPPQAYVLVLELSALDYISSAGIRSIFKARKALSPRGGKVLVVNPQPQIQKVFDLVKAVPMNEIFASTAEADAYLDTMQSKVLQGDDDDWWQGARCAPAGTAKRGIDTLKHGPPRAPPLHPQQAQRPDNG